MNKQEQIVINCRINNALDLMKMRNEQWFAIRRLRTCSAWVLETEHYYILKSYDTNVAFIDKDTGTCYDILRKVYGYTSTSAQHISKFHSDYGRKIYGCSPFLRWREL